MMNEINVQEYEEVVMDDRRLFFPPKLYTNENFVVNQEKTLLICQMKMGSMSKFLGH